MSVRREDRRRFVGALLCATASAASACTFKRTELRVAAASSLATALDALRAVAERRVELPVVMVYGATGLLARQIEQGAPFDVFASADRETPTRLERAGKLVAASTRVFARGRLVLWVPPERDNVVHGLSDVVDRRVDRIAIANPDVAPFGRAAREALQQAGLWDIVHARVVQADNVQQAYQFAASGNADVAFTSASVVSSGRGRAVPIAAGLYAPIDEAAGVVAGSRLGTQARAYIDLLLGPEGRAALEAHGFDPPPSVG
jgi:molybdate transport system substrate-binding protein